MKIDLKDYLTKRHKIPTVKQKKNPGPVITISREFGCDAIPITEKLATILSKGGPDWKIISKEILEESSRELHMNQVKMEHAFTPHEKNFVDDMLTGLSIKFDIPDKKVYKTIQEVIYNYAYDGNIIIVGRGGVAITREMQKSLHIRLMAPLEHRVKYISESRKTTLKHAREIVSSQDQRRKLFIQRLRGEVVDDSIFDLILNVVTLSEQQVIDTIIAAAKAKKIV